MVMETEVLRLVDQKFYSLKIIFLLKYGNESMKYQASRSKKERSICFTDRSGRMYHHALERSKRFFFNNICKPSFEE
jgi:hypothetical protein